MTDKPPPQNRFFRPYQFVLQEGSKIKSDLMDFRLVMMEVQCREVLRSPTRPINKKETAKKDVESDTLVTEMKSIAPKLEQTQSQLTIESANDTLPSSE
ncbi:hypothetical protein SCG7086_BD_00120 [Chlamydiales bacterium SCGC AG-110-P3]|nr:hypothetical protein SCG7086_BD_00120 [Chlamydiales bacterium SCGC AG-110-P3]